jgi:hypothetical protein
MTSFGQSQSQGITEIRVLLQFGQTIGETRFLEELLLQSGLDLSTEEGQLFLSRFVVSQLKASLLMAQEIDALKDELRTLRLAVHRP